ncbi:MAG: radical SAM protein [Planctomycetes bacterium]|nr:radical SAM protein [Planctomycetota bacterium]
MPCFEDVFFDFKPAKRVWKPLVKRLVTGTWKPMTLRPGQALFPAHLKRLGLYLHVPFCRNLCPYCPYNRIEYDEALYARFETAAHQEIDLYSRMMDDALRRSGRSRPRIYSLYLGGGTPTVDPRGLERLVSHMQQAFGPADDVCVELHPAAMDDECLDILASVGLTMLSIGVESLNDRILELIGRSHDAATAEDALKRALAKGFHSVNADIMFALPTQTLDDLDSDVSAVLRMGVDQVSTYPIFGFPYTDLGRKLGITGIKRPRGTLIREMLSLIRRRSGEYGLRQCAVWSFLRPGEKKFSSISRHHYIGIGPSAASMTGRQFYVNTFDVNEYASALPSRLPVAAVMDMTPRLEMAYWLYWRAYEMEASAGDFLDLFGAALRSVFGRLLAVPKLFGLLEEHGGSYTVTPKAAYWIHRLQNEYSLNYIDRLWGRCRTEPWPDEVRL